MFTQNYFWNAPGDKPERTVFEHARYLMNLYQERMQQHKINLLSYSRHDYHNVFGSGGEYLQYDTRLRLNVIKSIIDTVVARYGTMKVKPMFKTVGADWETYKQGLKLNKFTNGMFTYHKVYKKGKNTIKSGALYGLGGVQVITKDGKIEVEHVPSYELLYDEREARHGNPSFMFRVREIGRDVLVRDYDVPQDKAYGSHLIDATWTEYSNAGEKDRTTMIEAWRLPSENESGRYIACIDNYTLIDEKYDDEQFPIVTFGWHSSTSGGIWPQSLADEVLSIQVEINQLLMKAQRQMKLAGFMVFVEKGSKVNKGSLSNMDGSVIEFVGQPPIYHAIEAVAPETLRQIESLVDKAYDITGVNRLQSQGQKPGGLNSGVAIREYNDLGSERMKDVAQDIEDFYCEIAGRLVDAARKLSEEGATTEVMVDEKDFINKISWDDISLDRDKYQIAVYPTNFFATTPAAKYQQASEMHERGQINDAEFAQLMDMPDLEMVMKQKNAPYQNIMNDIELMNNGEKYESLDSFTDIRMAGPMVQAAFAQARLRGAPDDVQEYYRNYLLELENMAAELQAAQQPPQQQVEQPPAPAAMVPEMTQGA